MTQVYAFDITSAPSGEHLTRGDDQWLSDFAVCPHCKRMGAFCKETDKWYHVIISAIEGPSIPFVIDLCDGETGNWSRTDDALLIPTRAKHPSES